MPCWCSARHGGQSRSAEVPATVGGWDGGVGVVSSHTWRGPVQTIAAGPGDWVHRYFDEPSTPDITQGSSGGDVSLGIALVVPIWPIEEVIGKVGATFTLALR